MAKTFVTPVNTMELETKVSAKFQFDLKPSPHEQASLDALNFHAESICETLQPIFQKLIIEMLELKRGHYTTKNPEE